MLRSRAGWALAGLYLAVALLALWRAFTCRDDFFCGIETIPMLVPAGFFYLWLLVDHLPSPALLQWPLIVPTLITNVVLYYLLGRLIGKRVSRRRSH